MGKTNVKNKEMVRSMVMISMFTAVLSVCSFIRIPLPFTPVPVTLQIFAVTLTGLYLGKKNGAAVIALYMLLGMAGLPVFSGFQSGLGVFAGPTGGYLTGFLPGVFVIGFVYEKLKKLSAVNDAVCIYAASLAGLLTIYALGTVQLSLLLNITVWKALAAAVVPYVAPDVFKIIAAAVCLRYLRRV